MWSICLYLANKIRGSYFLNSTNNKLFNSWFMSMKINSVKTNVHKFISSLTINHQDKLESFC